LIHPGAFVITCNTAHMRLREYLEPYQSLYCRFVDIRSGILDDNGRRIVGDKCILLGTKRTSGVGLSGGEVGLYEEYRRTFCSDSEIITGSSEQQDLISSAIVDAKAGLMTAASRPDATDEDTCSFQNSQGEGGALEIHEMYAREKIMYVVDALRSEHGSDVSVVFGCTELPLPFSMLEMSHFGLFDPGQRLVEVVRKKMLEPVVAPVPLSSVDLL
jgi:aspartate/glutamate racemase